MSELNLLPINKGQNTAPHNENNARIAEQINNEVLRKDGGAMRGDIDMSHNALMNVPLATRAGMPIVYEQSEGMLDQMRAAVEVANQAREAGEEAIAIVEQALGDLTMYVVRVPTLKLLGDLLATNHMQASVASRFSNDYRGGGLYVYSAATPASEHDGVSMIHPDALKAWDGLESTYGEQVVGWTPQQIDDSIPVSGPGLWVLLNQSGAEGGGGSGGGSGGVTAGADGINAGGKLVYNMTPENHGAHAPVSNKRLYDEMSLRGTVVTATPYLEVNGQHIDLTFNNSRVLYGPGMMTIWLDFTATNTVPGAAQEFRIGGLTPFRRTNLFPEVKNQTSGATRHLPIGVCTISGGIPVMAFLEQTQFSFATMSITLRAWGTATPPAVPPMWFPSQGQPFGVRGVVHIPFNFVEYE